MKTKTFALVAVALLCAAAPAQTPTTLEYSWLTVGEPSGAQTTTIIDDKTTVEFEFADRGRGPKTRTTIQLSPAGFPTSAVISGNNYQKAAVNEQFTVRGDVATWSSSVEQGRAAFDGTAFYVPFNAPPEVMAMLARAALASEEKSVNLLPSGTASIQKVEEVTLQDAARRTRVTLFQIRGLDTRPSLLWLDDRQQFFGTDYGWFGVIRKGYEHHINTLKAHQKDASVAYFSDVATRHTERLDELLVIKDARIFDSLTGQLTEPATVMVYAGKITAIYFTPVAVPEGAKVIAAAGQTLLPTLWDMHGHVNANAYLNYLAAGVTNVRDMANEHDLTVDLARDVARNVIAGPDLYTLGFVDKRGEFSAPTGRLADTLDDARAHIDFYAQHGYVGIKLYSSIEPAWVEPLARQAHARGMSVQGHVPAFMDADQAIDAGYDELTHINMVLLNFLGGRDLDTRTPTRFKVPGERAGTIDLAAPEVGAFVRKMRDRDIALDPTLSIFMNLFLNEPGKVSPVFREVADHLPANVRRNAVASASYNDGQEERYRNAAKRSLQLTRLLHDNGIRLLPGTDNMLPGFTLIRELKYYAEAGIPVPEVLALATIGAARHLGQDRRLGSVSVGKDAQLYLVEGNPLENLSALYKVRHVIKGDKLYFAPDLLTEQGFKPF